MIKWISNNRVSVSATAYILLLFIAIIDYIIGYEISSSILYFFPIYLIVSNKQTSKADAIAIAAISSFAWLIIDILTDHPYSQQWILYWNAMVRAIIFFSIAMFVYKIKSENMRVEKANEQLNALNIEKNKYLGIAAHDIRNPLGSIYNLSSLLLDNGSKDNLTKQQIEFIELIHKISHSGLDLINNILDIAQIESGTLKLHKSERDYISFIKEIISTNKYIAERKEQTILLESEISELPMVFDQSYLNQVITNLLTNAIKYSYPKKEIQVVITKNEHYVKTEVIDQGVGIRNEDREKVFRPFEKAQNAPTAGERSSGLGLAITRKIIEAHQGEIGFDSIYGKGSTFYFILPLE